jgi:CBS domain-containing protein
MTMNAIEADQLLRLQDPFGALGEDERAEVLRVLSTSHFADGDTIVARWESPAAFYVVGEGAVEERDGSGVLARLGVGDAFDYKAMVEGRSEASFVARGRCSCLAIPAAVLKTLMRQNRAFREHVREALARRLDELLRVQQRREAGAFLLATVGDGPLHPPVFIPPETSVGEAIAEMRSQHSSSVLTRRDGRIGIFTSRDVREKLVLARQPESTPVGDLASYDLITLDHDDFVFNALVAMTKHAVRHVVITRDGDVIGVFEQDDLLTHVSDSSFAVAQRVEKASGVADLEEAGRSIPRLIRSLHERGTRPRYIARMVSDLNRKVFRRLYQELLPGDLADRACLLMLGSEGRGEQLLRTDQDNALILDDAVPRERLEEPLERFTRALIDLGYPPCAGNVMVSNPAWSRSLTQFETEIRHWIARSDVGDLMNLAILYDATAVAGDLTLLERLKSTLMARLRDGGTHLGYFARPVLNFPTPLGLFKRFKVERGEHRGALDIKKGGIFPIVHGVRSLSLENGIGETNTIDRIQLLKTLGVLASSFAADLIEAFDFMSMIRLRSQIEQMEQNKPQDNYIRPATLNRMDRSLLRLSLNTVDDFKKFLKYHFKIYLVS